MIFYYLLLPSERVLKYFNDIQLQVLLTINVELIAHYILIIYILPYMALHYYRVDIHMLKY